MTSEQQSKLIDQIFLMKSVIDSEIEAGKVDVLKDLVEDALKIIEWKPS